MPEENEIVSTVPARVPASADGLLRRGLQRHRRWVTLSVLLLSLWQLSEAMVPVVVGVVIDRAIAAQDLTSLVVWGAVLLVTFLSLSYAYRYGAALAFRIRQSETHALRMEIADHVLHPLGARTGLLTGETLSLATSDADAAGSVSRAITYTVASLIAVVVGSLALLRIDVVIGLAVLVGVPLVLISIQVLTPVISHRAQAQQARVATASGTATDLVKGLRVIKGIGAEDAASARYRTASQSAKKAGMLTAWSYGAMDALTVGLSGLLLGLIALLAGERAYNGTISVGEFVSIVGLTQFLSVPIGALGKFSAQMAGARGSARRIVEFLSSPRLILDGAHEPPGDVESVTVSLPDDGDLASRIHSTAGEFLGVVSQDPGSAARLGQFLDGEDLGGEGFASVNDVPVPQVKVGWRRSCLVVDPHRADLFEGSLRTNVDPLDALDEGSLATYLRASAADDVLASHPDGLDGQIAARGTSLSGGQRQRVALARALAADTAFLFLSDPTSSVDAVTEQKIAEGVRAVRHGPGSRKITWVVTSSPALLAQADRVVVMRAGKVIAQGRHAELLEDPTYQEMVLR